MQFKSLIKAISPKWVLSIYHWKLAWLGAIFYGFPSNKLIVIGVTGTNGKSTTVNFIAKVLQASGAKVGFVSTANVFDGQKEWLNKWKLTMPGRFTLQKMLRQMISNGCQYAIVETSSEGLIQHRHTGVNYDMAVFTNLTPEHLERHGGFENYKKAKGRLFAHLTRRAHKKINEKVIPKIIVVNGDDKYADYFLSFIADKKIAFGFTEKSVAYSAQGIEHIRAENLHVEALVSSFMINNQKFEVKLAGQFNAYNALAAVAAGQALGMSLEICARGVANMNYMPGRMEFIKQDQDFSVLIDYAPEPESMKQLYQAINSIPHERIIHVFGSCGGGRDQARRPILGRLVGENADVAIVTNEDPYDEDPKKIIEDVARGAQEVNQAEVVEIQDRREAIFEALRLARTGDLVVITGKSCEQWLCGPNGTKLPWDDRQVVREELSKLKM